MKLQPCGKSPLADTITFLSPQTVLSSGVPRPDAEQQTSLKVGGAMIVAFALGLILIWTLGYLPGTIGRTFSLFTGFLWTPLIMEPLFFLTGLFAILILNHYRRQRSGSELIHLETGPNSSTGESPLRPADFRDELQRPESKHLIATIEGAIEMGDHQEARRLLRELPDDQLDSEAVVAIRLQLAIHNQDPNHVRGLSRKLRELNPEHPLLAKVAAIGHHLPGAGF
jgi:hypothetical protein